jgi:hypothetical protein
MAREQLVKYAAKGEDVAPRIHVLAFDLLRRHVLRRADHHVRPGEGRHGRQLARLCDGGGAAVAARQGIELRQAEVQELDSLPGQQDVRGLEVAVDGALLVRRVQPRRSDAVADGLLDGQGPLIGLPSIPITVAAALVLADVGQRRCQRPGAEMALAPAQRSVNGPLIVWRRSAEATSRARRHAHATSARGSRISH